MKLKVLLAVALISGLTVIATLIFYLSLPDVSQLKDRNPESTALIELRKEQARARGKPLKVRQQWVAFDRIPKIMRRAIRISEDAAFYQHEGVDFIELKEALKKNFEQGRYVRGGSTITQQLAKNLYLSTEKSLWRKVKEYFIAKRLEHHLSKARIFHLYLNIIELGPGVFGVQAAARYYFHVDVSRLSLEQVVRLAAIIPRPLTINPAGSSRWLKWKARWILDKLKLYNYISDEEYQALVPVFKR